MAILRILLLCLLLPASAQAGASALPVTRGEIIRDFARITFEWPNTVYFTAKAEGRTLSITFDRKADPDFGVLLTRLHPFITRAERKADGRTIVLTLDRPYRIRTFVSDNINGIDLLDLDSTPPAAVAEKPSKKLQLALEKAEKLAAMAPAAGEETPAPAPAAAPEPAPVVETSPPAPPPAPVAEMPPPAPATAPVTETPPPAAEPPVAVAEAPKPPAVASEVPTPPPGHPDADASMPIPPDEVNIAADPNAPVKIGVSAASDNVVLRFPFAERMAMAVFVRAHTLWVVTHKPVKMDLSDFDAMGQTVIEKPKLLAGETATILRMPIDDGVAVNVARESGNFSWAVLVTQQKRRLEAPIKVYVNTDPPAQPHVFLPVLEVTDTIAIKDPVVGDTLAITALFNPGEGMSIERDFVEFSLLSTAQGIVVAKKAEDVSVVQLRNGLRVSAVGGATLTPGLPSVTSSSQESQELTTLFPYSYWKAESDDAIRKQRHELMRRIIFTEMPQEANSARLRIAQLYLSEGMAPEALAHLDGIKRVNPVYYRSAKLAALHGAANFLMYRFADAARDFAAGELNDNKEVDYWRAMLGDLLGNGEQSYDYLALNEDYISKYPPLFRQRLAIVAADRAIAAKEYNVALKIFDILHKDGQIKPIEQYISFLLAKVSSDTGQEVEALSMWDKLAEDYSQPFVRARAEFSRIVWGMEHESLTKDEVIDRLERLRLAWHGDSLELQVLTILGDLYAERQDYVNAMRIWNGAVISFPNTATSIEMARRMQEAFIVMFSEGAADKLPPLEALSLYYEYRNYMPTGAAGNAMIERMADKLLRVDLLDQAAGLLDHQMHFQAEKEQRSRIGARLAAIYLMDRQPRKSLQALQDSMYGENSLMLRLQRNRIAARAMADLDQPEKALSTLGQDDSPEAERIRIGVYWGQKDWPRVISSIEALLKARKDITAPVTLEESEYLLELALAYIFQNDTAQLKYLRDYFGPLMAGNPNQKVFEFVTSGDMPLTTTNFDEVVQYLSDTRRFIDNYHARQLATSASAPAPAAAAAAASKANPS